MSRQVEDVGLLAVIFAVVFPPFYFVSRSRYLAAVVALLVIVLGTFFVALGGFIPLIILVIYSLNDARKEARAFNAQDQANRIAEAVDRKQKASE